MSVAFAALAWPGLLAAAANDPTAPEVEVLGTYETGVGVSDAASLVIAQHSGDGKANQYFLRGWIAAIAVLVLATSGRTILAS